MNFFFRYKLHHILLWVSVFVFWREYYRLIDPATVAVSNSFVCTFFSALAFYLTWLYLVPAILKKKGLQRFLLFSCASLIILTILRSLSVYLTFQFYLPGSNYWKAFNSISASIFHIGYAITVATLVKLFADRYETQRMLDAIIKDNIQTELNYLKSQVNPHFLFNVHNSIYFLIDENPRKAAEVLLRLSAIMKYQLYECNKEMVLLSDEIEHIRNYTELEKMRIEEVVTVKFEDDIKNSGQQIAPFIILSFVENAFKHVSQDTNRSNEILISISATDEYLNLYIRNTVYPGKIRNAAGIGLANVKRRLELLYAEKFDLLSRQTGETYETTLKLAL